MIQIKKYHGLGNDFIIGQYKDFKDFNLSKVAKKLCHRQLGIGADGFILAKLHPIEMIYYNSDGSKASMCGNGIRCFAHYIYDQLNMTNQNYDVLTQAGIYPIKRESQNPFYVKVVMQKGDYHPASYHSKDNKKIFDTPIRINHKTYYLSSLLLGVVHTIIIVDQLDEKEILKIGPIIESHPFFKKKTNVNFVKIINKNHIELKTYERGAGLTLACGTGACATFDFLLKKKLINPKIKVSLQTGQMHLEYKNQQIYMSGPSSFIANISIKKEFLL